MRFCRCVSVLQDDFLNFASAFQKIAKIANKVQKVAKFCYRISENGSKTLPILMFLGRINTAWQQQKFSLSVLCFVSIVNKAPQSAQIAPRRIIGLICAILG